MKAEKIDAAAKAAGRFMMAALAAIKRIEADPMVEITGSKETAAARRASMDLTRALADLRSTAH